jgi:hypothetical protein
MGHPVVSGAGISARLGIRHRASSSAIQSSRTWLYHHSLD